MAYKGAVVEFQRQKKNRGKKLKSFRALFE
jgi:hypothetical protein